MVMTLISILDSGKNSLKVIYNLVYKKGYKDKEKKYYSSKGNFNLFAVI